MRKKINFAELCKMITENNVPDRIFINDNAYVWRNADYRCDDSFLVEDYFLKELCQEIEIEYEISILTLEEKSYLRSIIKPFRDRVEYIRKHSYTDMEFIHIECRVAVPTKLGLDTEFIVLPAYEIGKYYRHMESNKDYALEELGL